MNQDLNSITESTIGCAYTVSNTLGHGFLEKVYENALAHELSKKGLQTQKQVPIKVTYEGICVGDYQADILVNGKILLEIKAQQNLSAAHMAQCMNYLKATGLKICLLINFGKPRVEVKRVVLGL
ncbi:GxxExxY protein [Planctomycetota bacterium]